MGKNNLLAMLSSGLRDAERQIPECDTLAMGFTKIQMLKMDLKKPRLIWFDSASKIFYDQGDSTKISKSQYSKITAKNFKKDRPINNLKYYIPINNTIIAESDKPLD